MATLASVHKALKNIQKKTIPFSYKRSLSDFPSSAQVQTKTGASMALTEGGWVLFYWGLFLLTTYVNKYVLSVLSFTYPTIFQGWQTLVGALVLRSLFYTRKMEADLTEINRTSVARWLPAMMLYVLIIYSGSVALSQLPIPIFLSLHNITLVISATVDLGITRKVASPERYIALMLIVFSSVMVGYTDPRPSAMGYMWMTIHIIATGAYPLLEQWISPRISLGDTERIYCNYVYSVIVLAPSSYFLGDALAAREFPFLYFYRFYFGCVVSGLCGVLLSVCMVRLKTRPPTAVLTLDQISGVAKILCAFFSLIWFEYDMIATNSFWILANLVGGLLVIEPLARTRAVLRSLSESSTDHIELFMAEEGKEASTTSNNVTNVSFTPTNST